MAPVVAIGIGATLAAGFMTAAGDIFGAQAQKKVYDYQAGIARQRAAVEEQNARFAFSAGESGALRSGMGGAFRGGQIAAAQGASNVALSSPSSAAVRAGQTMVTQMDEANIRTGAARQAYGRRVAAAEDVAQAGVDVAAGETAVTAGYIGAASSILGAVGKAAGSVDPKWLQASNANPAGSQLLG